MINKRLKGILLHKLHWCQFSTLLSQKLFFRVMLVKQEAEDGGKGGDCVIQHVCVELI